MIQKIWSILICSLLLLMILPQTNSNYIDYEVNTDIEDDQNDVLFGCIDIVSAWFFEDAEDPDYMYVAIKVKDLQYKWITTGYAFYWLYNSSFYCSFLTTWSQGNYILSNVIRDGVLIQQVAGSCDLEKNVVAMKIPKNIIEDPNPGDVLMRPYVFTTYSLFGNILGPLSPLSDYAPNNLQGKNYVIQY